MSKRRTPRATFTPSGSWNPYHRQASGRGYGNIDGLYRPGTVANLVLTGAYGRPSWPAKALPEQRVALPRAKTKRQAKADDRLRSLGGDAYPGKGQRDGRAAA